MNVRQYFLGFQSPW